MVTLHAPTKINTTNGETGPTGFKNEYDTPVAKKKQKNDFSK